MVSMSNSSLRMSMTTHNHGSFSNSGSSGNSTVSSAAMIGLHMAMNSYLTRKYDKCPVIFKKLYANSKA